MLHSISPTSTWAVCCVVVVNIFPLSDMIHDIASALLLVGRRARSSTKARLVGSVQCAQSMKVSKKKDERGEELKKINVYRAYIVVGPQWREWGRWWSAKWKANEDTTDETESPSLCSSMHVVLLLSYSVNEFFHMFDCVIGSKKKSFARMLRLLCSLRCCLLAINNESLCWTLTAAAERKCNNFLNSTYVIKGFSISHIKRHHRELNHLISPTL